MQTSLTSTDIRARFLAFFAKRGHSIIPSASLVTTDEKGVTNATLFNTAGMQPLIPYLLGKAHPAGVRLVDSQKCLRTIDIDEVGDNTHATFFEMLGNWSLGDYFKREAIEWSYEFLTSTSETVGDQGLGLDPKRLYVTVFKGDDNAERDTESAEIWEKIGVPKHRIYFKDAASNWWPAVKPGKDSGWTGPTGPCSEMFYDITPEGLGDLSPDEFEKADAEQKVVEIWNDVFMEYEKKDGVIVGKLSKKNVDTGAGLERLVTVIQRKDNIYDTDLLALVMEEIRRLSKNWDLKSARIVADHIKAAVFLIADGVLPDNADRGYVLRKLIRRAVRHSDILGMPPMTSLDTIAGNIQRIYVSIYQETNGSDAGKAIRQSIRDEETKFRETLSHGMKEFDRLSTKPLSGNDAFLLYSSYGFPIELTEELSREKGRPLSTQAQDEFAAAFKAHQSLSRAGAEQKFKGGLADATDPMVVRYHTATHLLHQALHDVLGENEGNQKGSNITAERLRFDFTGVKLTDDQKKRVEDIVNEKIVAALPMNNAVLPRSEAETTGARHFFGEKYGDEISVYFIGQTSGGASSIIDDIKNAYSKEFCGGPHVKNTSELAGPEGKWRFKIQKEEAVSQGVRRIKAVLA